MEEVEVEITQGVGKKKATTRSGGGDDDGEKRSSSGKKGARRRLLTFIKRMQLKETSAWKWRWRFLGSSAFKWRLRSGSSWHVSFVDDVLFKIVSAVEAVVLVATLCLFFLCCGCHF